MRHLIPVCMTILSLASAPVCSAAYAETITALAVPVNPEHPEKAGGRPEEPPDHPHRLGKGVPD